MPAVGAVGAAGVAVVLGLTPTLSADPELTAATYYLRGTDIGDEPTDADFDVFMGRVFGGTHTTRPADTVKIPYNAGLWPVSRGGLEDLTWNASVREGVGLLGDKNPGSGDVVFAFSQGAVVASKYKAENPHTGATFILFENPSRPNGGVMQRFNGLTIPILDITFSGATKDTDDLTLDIARQYSGWSDFPTYPLNLLATANAILGIIYLHGPSQRYEDLEDELAAIVTDKDAPGYNPDYYQKHGNTEYYLIPTARLPLLMPLSGIVPDNILDALDKPLRAIIETGYNRGDYSEPTGARLFPKLSDLKIDLNRDLSNTRATNVARELAKSRFDATTQNVDTLDEDKPKPTKSKLDALKPDLPKLDLRDRLGVRHAGGFTGRSDNNNDSGTPAVRATSPRPGGALRTALRSLTHKSDKPKAEASAPQD